MKISTLFVVLTAFILMILSPCYGGEQRIKAGVMKFSVAQKLDPSLGDFLYETLLEQMLDTGKFIVIDGEMIAEVQKNISKSQPLISEKEAQRLALNQLGIQKIYLGSLNRVGKEYYISVKVLNPDSSVERIERLATKKEDELPECMTRLAGNLLFSAQEVKVRKEKAETKKRKKKDVPKYEYPDKGEEIGRDGRFIAYSGGVVVDGETGLMWAAKDNGIDLTWTYADYYCRDYKGAGYEDWRMPTIEELRSLYRPEKRSRFGYHITELINLTQSYVWSSETSGNDDASYFRFLNGREHWSRKSYNTFRRILPVRDNN